MLDLFWCFIGLLSLYLFKKYPNYGFYDIQIAFRGNKKI